MRRLCFLLATILTSAAPLCGNDSPTITPIYKVVSGAASGTSLDVDSLPLGNTAFTTAAYLAAPIGSLCKVTSISMPTVFMFGRVADSTTSAITVNVQYKAGTNTPSLIDWRIEIWDSPAVTPLMFGAVGDDDNTPEDTSGVQNCIDAAAALKCEAYFPGSYVFEINSMLIVPANAHGLTIRGDGHQSVIEMHWAASLSGTNRATILSVAGNSPSNRLQHVTIRDLHLIGYRNIIPNLTANFAAIDSTDGCGILLVNTRGCTIADCYIEKMQRTGIRPAWGNGALTIARNMFHGTDTPASEYENGYTQDIDVSFASIANSEQNDDLVIKDNRCFSHCRTHISAISNTASNTIIEGNLCKALDGNFNEIEYTDTKENSFAPANVDSANNLITISNHGYLEDQKVTLDSTNTRPANLEANQVYLVKFESSSTFKLKHATPPNNIVDIDAGAGRHFIRAVFEPADINITSNAITIKSHGYVNGDSIHYFAGPGSTMPMTGPQPILHGQRLTVRNVTANTFTLEIEGGPGPGQREAGAAAVDFVDAGAGIFVLRKNNLLVTHNIVAYYDLAGSGADPLRSPLGAITIRDNMCVNARWQNIYGQKNNTTEDKYNVRVQVNDNYCIGACRDTTGHQIGHVAAISLNGTRASLISGNYITQSFATPSGGAIAVYQYGDNEDLLVTGNVIDQCEANSGCIYLQPHESNVLGRVKIAGNDIFNPQSRNCRGIEFFSGAADGLNNTPIFENNRIYFDGAITSASASHGIFVKATLATGTFIARGNLIVRDGVVVTASAIEWETGSNNAHIENNHIHGFANGIRCALNITSRKVDEITIRDNVLASCTTGINCQSASGNGLVVVENNRFPGTTEPIETTNVPVRAAWEGKTFRNPRDETNPATLVRVYDIAAPTNTGFVDGDIVVNAVRSTGGVDQWERISNAWNARIPFPAWITKTATASLAAEERFVKVDASGGVAGFTITLPSAASVESGHTIFLKNLTNDADIVQIDGNGSETIDGVSLKELRWLNETLVVTSDGSNWFTPIEPAQHTFGPLGAMRIKLVAFGDRYLGPASTVPGTIGTVPVAANFLYASPMAIQHPVNINQIGVEITTAAAGATQLRLGLYRADADGEPGALVYGSAPLAADTTGPKTESISPAKTLEPGLYWLAIASNGSPTVRAISPSMTLWGLTSLGDSSHDVRVDRSFPFATLPDPWGTPSNWSASVPNMMVRIAH